MGKTPYPALDPPTLLRMLREGHHLEYPDNLTCSPEMYSEVNLEPGLVDSEMSKTRQ